MFTQFHNARILTPFSQTEGVVLVSDGQIVDILRSANSNKSTKVIDAAGMYLVPGYVDIHAHGSAGAHVMDGTVESITRMCNEHAACGTTTIVPTTSGSILREVELAVGNIHAASKAKCDATIAGAHIQGLFTRRFSKDGQKESMDMIDEADWNCLFKHKDFVRMVGVAPEIPGAMRLGDALKGKGIVASIAYSDAEYEQILTAVSHGFSDMSDLYASGHSIAPRRGFHVPGVFESGLVMDEMTVQVVADGWQLPQVSLQIVYRCKNAEAIILTSNAREQDIPPGRFEEGFPSMALLVRNMVAAGVSIRVALRMATVNPARRIGMDNTKGRIAAGYDADILLLDNDLNVRFCMAKGRILKNELDALDG